jgi:hypothetical protein
MAEHIPLFDQDEITGGGHPNYTTAGGRWNRHLPSFRGLRVGASAPDLTPESSGLSEGEAVAPHLQPMKVMNGAEREREVRQGAPQRGREQSSAARLQEMAPRALRFMRRVSPNT